MFIRQVWVGSYGHFAVRLNPPTLGLERGSSGEGLILSE